MGSHGARPAIIAFEEFAKVDIRAGTIRSGFASEVLVLGFADAAGAVVLIEPTGAVPNGARLS